MNKMVAVFAVSIVANVMFAALFSIPLMYIWNLALVPAVSVLNEITWLQMVGIYILIRVITETKLTMEFKK